MFCDEVLSRHAPGAGKDFLASTHKFILTPEFIDVANQLGKTHEDCIGLKHLFRLPHNPMWLEPRPMRNDQCGIILQQLSELDCANLNKNKRGNTSVPITDAIRIVQLYPDPHRMHAWLALPHTLRLSESGSLKMNIALFSDPDGNPVGDPYPPKEFMDWMVVESIKYCCYIATLNSRTLVELETPDLSRLNSARERRGKPPQSDHKIVHIKRNIRQMMREAAQANENDVIGVRAHWRRGHFKVRKTGVFWWSPHMAGKTELGQVEKQYVA